jgi:hypothetical protein
MASSCGTSLKSRGDGSTGCGSPFIPDAVSYKIFGQLDLVDLIQISLVCKEFRRQTTELRKGWEEEKAAAEESRYNWAHD